MGTRKTPPPPQDNRPRLQAPSPYSYGPPPTPPTKAPDAASTGRIDIPMGGFRE